MRTIGSSQSPAVTDSPIRLAAAIAEQAWKDLASRNPIIALDALDWWFVIGAAWLDLLGIAPAVDILKAIHKVDMGTFRKGSIADALYQATGALDQWQRAQFRKALLREFPRFVERIAHQVIAADTRGVKSESSQRQEERCPVRTQQ